MKKKYEGQGKLIEKALEKIRQEGLVVNAWNTFAPEVEVDRLECINQREEINPNDEDEMDNVPDFAVDRSSSIAVPAIEAPKLSPDFVRKLYQSLNETQAYFTLLRVKRKMEALTDEDRALLTKTVIDIKDCPLDALHIFATNKEVDEHNRKTVAALHTDFVNIKAQDYAKDPTTDLTPDEHHAKMDGSNPKVKSRIISEDCSEDGSRSPCEESAFQLKA
ncbi:hypothetical protein D5F01_LYC11050 [Larimichthys crocea]|uniref:Uncharacterized protein n=1 Tax=Larimichthys crocea TaxID=215358 RepID=A0A6G0IIV5_LARCR|nr:hypothetical protein D5F01_LYC11050 [Larimichthys crocea]